jgi:hypothetical protein
MQLEPDLAAAGSRRLFISSDPVAQFGPKGANVSWPNLSGLTVLFGRRGPRKTLQDYLCELC